MPTQIHRGDSAIVRQVTTLTPTVTNTELFDLLINGKTTDGYTSDGVATAQEIVEGLQAALTANANGIPEVAEITWSENDAAVIATGRADGQTFTVAEGPGSGDFASITTGTVAKSPNHWIAENFSAGTLPATGEDIYFSGGSVGVYWGLDQNAVTLASLHFPANYTGNVGLPETNSDGSTPYYQAGYRDTHLKISATVLQIGSGSGNGSGRLKLNLGANACECTVFRTSSNHPSQDEAAVHLVGSHASNALHMFGGTVDIAMLPGYTSQWPAIVVSGGVLRCGSGVTLGVVESTDNGSVETRSAVTTYRTRGNGRALHIGDGNITTADIQGGPLKIQATGTLTIGTLNGYGGKELDLSECDSAVTITNATIYGTPQSPFTIRDPNNRLTMTNAASTPNGAQSLVVVTGSGRNVRIT